MGTVEAKTATSAAVLFVEASGRYFAFVFGYGKALLDPSAYERDFGLKVTLNAVKPELLRSVDAKTFESPLTLLTRRQTSRGSSLDAFGLDVSHDLLQAVAGEPRDASFAHRLLGSDALAFSAAIEFDDLAAKCEELFAMYGKDTYKERFAFIDRLRRITDPSKVEALEHELETRLQAGQIDRMHLAAPEVEDLEREDWIGYTTQPERRHLYLDIEEFLATVPKTVKGVTVPYLKHQHVILEYSDGPPVEKWTVFNCLTAEIDKDKRLCILSDGDWFEADPDYSTQIADRVREIATRTIHLPDAKTNEKEEAFNSRVAKQLGHALLDRKLARCANTTSPIEVCDFLTADRQLVHVKKKTRSATLSHLFAQGVVSAEALLTDGAFREDAREFIQEVRPALVDLVPHGRPAPDQYEVAYVVITHRLNGWPLTLPFFSQVNLCNAARRLGQLGYNVSLTAVGNG